MISPVGASIRRIMVLVRRVLPSLLILCVLPASAFAAGERERGGRGTPGRARTFYNAKPLPSQVSGVSISPAEGIASYTHSVTLTLQGSEAVDLALPARFGVRTQNGRSYVPGRPTG